MVQESGLRIKGLGVNESGSQRSKTADWQSTYANSVAVQHNNTSFLQVIIDRVKVDGLVKSQNLTPSRKERKVNQLILNGFFLAFLATLLENKVFTICIP